MSVSQHSTSDSHAETRWHYAPAGSRLYCDMNGWHVYVKDISGVEKLKLHQVWLLLLNVCVFASASDKACACSKLQTL